MGVRLGEMPLMYRGWISMRSPNMNRMMVAMREKIVVNFETWRLKGWEKNESFVFVFCAWCMRVVEFVVCGALPERRKAMYCWSVCMKSAIVGWAFGEFGGNGEDKSLPPW
jgi:hypothetical protein